MASVLVLATACGQSAPDLPGRDVARLRPFESGEPNVVDGAAIAIPGTLRFEEPGCLVWTREEDGGRFAALVPSGATVLDGELLLPVDGEGEGAYRTIPLPAEWNGNIRAYTASRLEDEADLVDPDTPLDEFCPGWNSWMVFGRNVPPRAG